MKQDDQVYERPDDPYTVRTRWDADGFHIIVTADILPGGDPEEVTAEAQRRADSLRDMVLDFVERSAGRSPQ